MKRFDLEKVEQKLFEQHNGNIIMKNYIKVGARASFECCVCGNLWEATVADVINVGNGCAVCSHKNGAAKRIYSIETVINNIFSTHGNNIEIIPSSYISATKKAEFHCNICDNYWYAKPISVYKDGNGCQECGYITGSKKRQLSNSNLWLGGTTEIRKFIADRIKTWKRKSSNLCKNRCIFTGSKEYELHHLYPLNKIIFDVFNELNLDFRCKINDYNDSELDEISQKVIEIHYRNPFGVCLRKDIHKLFHKIYGDDCLPDDFYEFQDKINSGEIPITY